MENIENKYFIDENKYNCPFCKNRNVKYIVLGRVKFDETIDKQLYAVFVECSHCHKVSLHLLKNNSLEQDCNFLILNENYQEFRTYSKYTNNFKTMLDLSSYKDISSKQNYILCNDENIILNIPTSFFTIDDRIPKKLRILIDEAEKCIKNNCLTGASACIRKTIYEFLVLENAIGDNYQDKIKSLKGKYINLENDYIDILSNIQGIMCDQVHEQSIHESFNSKEAKTYIEILKDIFNQVYVIPQELKDRKSKIDNLIAGIKRR